MNLAQVEAYLADEVPSHSLSAWASRDVDPRKWEPLSVLQRTYPEEYKRQARKARGTVKPCVIDGKPYPSRASAARALGVHVDTIASRLRRQRR